MNRMDVNADSGYIRDKAKKRTFDPVNDLPEVDVFSLKDSEKVLLGSEKHRFKDDFREKTYKEEYKKVIADGKIVKTEEELLRDLEHLLQLSKDEAQRLRSEVELNENKKPKQNNPLNSGTLSGAQSPDLVPKGFIPDYVEEQALLIESIEADLKEIAEEKILQPDKFLLEKKWNSPENVDDITWLSLYEKGLEYYRAGMFEQSLYYYEKAISLEPNSFKLWASKGMTLFWLDKPKYAIKCINKSLKLNPRYARAWSNKGLILKQKGKMDQALKCFAKALKYNPEFANGWYEMAQIFQSTGNYEKAVKYYNKALKLQPKNRAALFYRNECNRILKYAS